MKILYFYADWTEQYLFILPWHDMAKQTCLLCLQSISVCKVANLKRLNIAALMKHSHPDPMQESRKYLALHLLMKALLKMIYIEKIS